MMGLTAMTGIGISNDRPQVINCRAKLLQLLRPFGEGLSPCEALLAVMEELGREELGDLVGDGVGGVV